MAERSYNANSAATNASVGVFPTREPAPVSDLVPADNQKVIENSLNFGQPSLLLRKSVVEAVKRSLETSSIPKDLLSAFYEASSHHIISGIEIANKLRNGSLEPTSSEVLGYFTRLASDHWDFFESQSDPGGYQLRKMEEARLAKFDLARLERYDDRPKGENAQQFFDRVWGRYRAQGILYRDDIVSLLGDDKLIPAMHSYCSDHDLNVDEVLPPPATQREHDYLKVLPPESLLAKRLTQVIRNRARVARHRGRAPRAP